MARRINIKVQNRRNKVGVGRILFHFILGCLTGGIWWIILAIRFLLK